MSEPAKSRLDRKDSNTPKSKKKKSAQERSTGHPSARDPIPEESSDQEQDEEDLGQQLENTESGQEEQDTGDSTEISDTQLILSELRFLNLSMSSIADRVDTLEIARNLHEDEYSTPGRKGSKYKKATPSLLESVKKSKQKHDWKEMSQAQAEEVSDEEDLTEESSDSSESELSDSGPRDNYSSRSKKKKKHKSKKHKTKHARGEGSRDLATAKNPLNSLFRNLEASSDLAAKTVVNVTRVEKECNVRISDFALAKVCKAIKLIMEFQERESTLVNMAKVLSTSCKQHLRIMYNIQTADLATMQLSTLFGVIAKETKVHSKVQFYSELKAAMSTSQLMEWSSVTASNHETFYFQQLALAEEFMLLLRIMLQENKEFCPNVNDKENGLIRLFRSFHSHTYWRYLWTGMTQRYRTMQQFIEEYCTKAMEQYQLSQALKEVPYAKKGDDKDKEEEYYKKKREVTKAVNSGSYSRFNRTPKPVSFNHINSGEAYDSADSHDSADTWRNAQAVKTDRDKQSRDNSDCSVSDTPFDEPEEQEAPENRDEAMLDTMLAAFADHKVDRLDKKDLPCLRKLLSGKCEATGCPYGHKGEVLVKGAHDMKAKLNAFLTSQGVAPRPPFNAGVPRVAARDNSGR